MIDSHERSSNFTNYDRTNNPIYLCLFSKTYKARSKQQPTIEHYNPIIDRQSKKIDRTTSPTMIKSITRSIFVCSARYIKLEACAPPRRSKQHSAIEHYNPIIDRQSQKIDRTASLRRIELIEINIHKLFSKYFLIDFSIESSSIFSQSDFE